MKRKSTKRNGFSLLELLAVMFIIAIIFSIALPAFGPAMSAMRLNTAAENLANALESAKQYAQTSGVDCYVVFPTTTNETDLNYRSYKIYSYNGTNGRSIGKWERLPTGLMIDVNSTFFSQQAIPVHFTEDSDGTVNLPCIKFVPSGRAEINASVRINDNSRNTFSYVIFYNRPAKVSTPGIGVGPDE